MPGWVLVSRRISPPSPRALVPAEVGAADPAAAERLVRAQRVVEAGGGDLAGISAGTTCRDPPGAYLAW